MVWNLSGPAAHGVESSAQCIRWLKQRLGQRLSTVLRCTVRNVNYHQRPNLKVLIYQNVTIISKTSTEGNFPATDACLSTGKADRDLKERELIFIMLLSLPLQASCLPVSFVTVSQSLTFNECSIKLLSKPAEYVHTPQPGSVFQLLSLLAYK